MTIVSYYTTFHLGDGLTFNIVKLGKGTDNASFGIQNQWTLIIDCSDPIPNRCFISQQRMWRCRMFFQVKQVKKCLGVVTCFSVSNIKLQIESTYFLFWYLIPISTTLKTSWSMLFGIGCLVAFLLPRYYPAFQRRTLFVFQWWRKNCNHLPRISVYYFCKNSRYCPNLMALYIVFQFRLGNVC